MAVFNLIEGGQHEDIRGILYHINDFDMTEVRRMYRISHPLTKIQRGWRAHLLEQRWFYVVKGSFKVGLIKIDNFNTPDPNLSVDFVELAAKDTKVLHVPRGYATAFQALEDGSSFMVYADTPIEDSMNDNYLFPIDYFVNYNL